MEEIISTKHQNMSWLFYSLMIILLATFNVFALDSISKIRKDIGEILRIVKDLDGDDGDDDDSVADNKKRDSSSSLIVNAPAADSGSSTKPLDPKGPLREPNDAPK
jgi:hypothetical protein